MPDSVSAVPLGSSGIWQLLLVVMLPLPAVPPAWPDLLTAAFKVLKLSTCASERRVLGALHAAWGCCQLALVYAAAAAVPVGSDMPVVLSTPRCAEVCVCPAGGHAQALVPCGSFRSATTSPSVLPCRLLLRAELPPPSTSARRAAGAAVPCAPLQDARAEACGGPRCEASGSWHARGGCPAHAAACCGLHDDLGAAVRGAQALRCVLPASCVV